MKVFVTLGAYVFLAMGIIGIANADPMIDFVVTGAGGSISWAGGSAALVGSGLPVILTVGQNGTPLNNNVSLACISCSFDFTTGSFSYATATSWVFNNGGSVSLNGTLIGPSGTVASGTLLSGTFGGGSPNTVAMPFGTGTFDIAGAIFSSWVNPGLTTFYGTQPSPPNYAGTMNISFLANNLPPAAFTSTAIISGNVAVHAPEPLSIVLLGTILLGCVALVRRQRTHV